MNHITFSRPMRQTGVGLVELMVGLVIGIVLELLASRTAKDRVFVVEETAPRARSGVPVAAKL